MSMKKNYVDNMYAWLTRKGLAAKYEHAGIYCIKLDNTIVYIGKSTNMLRRIQSLTMTAKFPNGTS